MIDSRKHVCLATASAGLEGVVKRELLSLGFEDAKAELGAVRFTADYAGMMKACLWLACADRVLIVVREGHAETFEDLFQLVLRAPWSDYLPKDAAIPVSGRCSRSKLMSVRDCQAITKKAIVEHMKRAFHTQLLPETGPRFQVDVALHGDTARLTLDASGEALNRRGYRTWNGEAPLRETLAAAMARLAFWDKRQPLHDPCCGTGTLLIEAAFYAARRAPGLNRSFDLERWPYADARELSRLREEAAAAFDPSLIPPITGSDLDPNALELCHRHIRQAGLESYIRVYPADLRQLTVEGPSPCFIANPPYGERLGDKKQCEELYRAFKPLMLRHPGCSLNLITSHPGFERVAGLRSRKKTRMYNGRLECDYMRF